ncbi:response regulator [Candidatus Daviesbacteria bacterium]|nr:response regulator [Candidatus Daviesbacteria bacterium]
MVRKILVIEDDKLLVRLLVEKLIDKGFAVSVAYDGVEGYNKAIAEKPDLILLDVIMPKMDGVTLLKKLRVDDGTKLTKTIILSNISDEQKVAELQELGADTVWTKGQHNIDELVAEVVKL